MIGNLPSKKKKFYGINQNFQKYLERYGRSCPLPLQYDDMFRFFSSVPLKNQSGEETLWETVYYEESEAKEINEACCQIYALLNTEGDLTAIDHLEVDRIDYCMFGNTHPYRVRIINKINDNYDHFYIKKIDASRVYGLELEHILSPNRISFIVDEKTIIEEHIAGIPGDTFMIEDLNVSDFEKIRIAKEFVKFNERCFARLLGDMRAYNYVMDITPDIEGSQYRLRAIDFDQQSYEGRMNFYRPQYFKDNNEIIKLGFDHLTYESVRQYQLEERSNIARRARSEKARLNNLIACMKADRISSKDKIRQLAQELADHHKSNKFEKCTSMGDLVLTNIKLLLDKEFKQSIDIFEI